MRIELMDDSRQISSLAQYRETSAIQVRDFAVRGVLSGNLWQLMGTAPNGPGPPTDRGYALLQTHGVIELRELTIESTEWHIPDLSRDLQHEAV